MYYSWLVGITLTLALSEFVVITAGNDESESRNCQLQRIIECRRGHQGHRNRCSDVTVYFKCTSTCSSSVTTRRKSRLGKSDVISRTHYFCLTSTQFPKAHYTASKQIRKRSNDVKSCRLSPSDRRESSLNSVHTIVNTETLSSVVPSWFQTDITSSAVLVAQIKPSSSIADLNTRTAAAGVAPSLEPGIKTSTLTVRPSSINTRTLTESVSSSLQPDVRSSAIYVTVSDDDDDDDDDDDNDDCEDDDGDDNEDGDDDDDESKTSMISTVLPSLSSTASGNLHHSVSSEETYGNTKSSALSSRLTSSSIVHPSITTTFMVTGTSSLGGWGTLRTSIATRTLGTRVVTKSLGTSVVTRTLGTSVVTQTLGTSVVTKTLGTSVVTKTLGTSVVTKTLGTSVETKTLGTSVVTKTLGTSVVTQTLGTSVVTKTLGTSVVTRTLGTSVVTRTLGTSVVTRTLGTSVVTKTLGTSVVTRTPSIVTTTVVHTKPLLSASLNPQVTSDYISPTKSSEASYSFSSTPHTPGKMLFCSTSETGNKFYKGVLNWPKTRVGARANVSCHYNTSIAYRWCRINTTDMTHGWQNVHNEECPALETKNMNMGKLLQMKITEENEEEVAILMNYLTSHSNVSVNVVKMGAELLEKLVEKAKNLSKISKDLLSSVSNVMNGNSNILAEAHQQDKSTKRILENIGKLMENVNLSGRSHIHEDTSNLIAEAWDVNITEDLSFMTSPAPSTVQTRRKRDTDPLVSITLPSSLLNRYKHVKRISFFNFMNDKLFPQQTDSTKKFINSGIVSASIKGKKVGNLSDPVVIEFKINNESYSRNCSCVYWDFDANNGYGEWSKQGCVYERIDSSRARCRCNHLTHFGILVDLFPDKVGRNLDELILETITFIGCYLSIAGLVLTMITLISFEKYRTGISGKILLNLCLALFFFLVVFLAGIDKVENEAVCVTVAGFLHYFILVAVFWMGAEAFHLFLNIVLVRLPGQLGKTFVLKCAVIAWILPLIIVLPIVLAKTEDYKSQSYCRVSGNAFYIAFLVPTLTVMLINLIILMLVIKSLLSSSLQTDTRRSIGLLHFRRVLGIMTVFGITWLFGVLAVGDLRIIFQYLFCISNSLQGFMIFVIYCLTDTSVRERLIRFLCFLPEHDSNRVLDSSQSTQHQTDIEIELSDFERRPSFRRQWLDPRPISVHENAVPAWLIPGDELEDVPCIYPGSRPRVNVPLPEPGPGVDNLVLTTISQPGLVLEQSGGETSLRSAAGSIIFINNGRVVDVPKYPSVPEDESSLTYDDTGTGNERGYTKKRKVKIATEVSEVDVDDLKRWSEVGWLPKLKSYSETLSPELKNDDELGTINFSHFQCEPKRPRTAGVRRQDAGALRLERAMADDDVEHAYYQTYRDELNDHEEIASNFLAASASASAAKPLTTNPQNERLRTEEKTTEILHHSTTSSASETSSNSSLRWSEAGWLPSLKSYSQATLSDLNSDDEIPQTNVAHFQEF